MSKRSWTPSQLDAITTKYRSNGESCNLLLSAAAGSGKTAVLVERVIRKILPDDITKGTDINRLLIVTFTNAAAREMSERIGVALTEELEKANREGDSQRAAAIKKQQLLLGISEITTIDSFCLKLIREHFNALDIEPDFTIAESTLAHILSEEAMEELFASLYDENDEDFLNLLSLYATSRSDSGLSDLIRHIYEFTRAIPYPEKWLSEKAEDLKCSCGITETAWFKKGLADCKKAMEDALSYAEKGLSIMCETPFLDAFLQDNPPQKDVPIYEEWKAYYNAFYKDYQFLKAAKDASFDELSALYRSFSFASLAKLTSKTDEEKELLKSLRESVKATVSNVSSFLLMDTAKTEELLREQLYPNTLSLIKLIEKYHRIFMKKKLDKNVLEFHDAEQFTAQLLAENPEITALVQAKYDEILMDEYQDTNLLQEEIFRQVTCGNNLFMVGDMKQSIYRFRNSDPTIFKSKSDAYNTEEDSADRKIILSKNFRRRGEVLDSVNDIFEAIMSEDAGELDYNKDQMLYLGNPEFAEAKPDCISECHIIEAPSSDYNPEDDEDVTNPAIEARLVAAEINKLKANHFKVFDGKGYRDIENRDIVILMSSFKYSADSYISELQNAGIQCFAEASGYFERTEIVTMLALLKTLCNPYCDIPLLAVMRSPIGAFSDDELVTIRGFKKGRFFSALKKIASETEFSDEDTKIVSEKAAAFCDKIDRWRKYSRYMSADQLLWQLYEESDFYAFCSAIPDGEESQANLRLLFERAKQYEQGGFEGLFNFVRYMENVQQKDTDLSSAKLAGESHNVVRIMTIHKSKGLEFPVVFITGGGKKFYMASKDSRILLHKDYGIAPEFVDSEKGFRSETPQRSVFKNVSNSEQISEEIRKLYVATTRAKEKLYFVATVPGKTDKSGKTLLEKYVDGWNQQVSFGKATFSANQVLSAGSFMEWVAPVALASPNWKFSTINHIDIGSSYFEDLASPSHTSESFDPVSILDYKYPFREISAIPTKISVSELKAKRETVINPMPAFLCEKEDSGASYGTALHKIMQHLMPATDENTAREGIKNLISSGILSANEADKIPPKKITEFYNSKIGQRIMSCPTVYKEQPFEVEINVSDVYPEIGDSEEKILLQGVIDCYFEENGEIVLVDYKTDRYNNPQEIHEKYDKQLELYAYALQKITGMTVKEKIIYLFSTGEIL